MGLRAWGGRERKDISQLRHPLPAFNDLGENRDSAGAEEVWG